MLALIALIMISLTSWIAYRMLRWEKEIDAKEEQKEEKIDRKIE